MTSTIEAATLLGVQPKTVRNLIDDGDLAACRVGRVIKVRPGGGLWFDSAVVTAVTTRGNRCRSTWDSPSSRPKP